MLKTNQNAMVGLGMLAQSVLGTSTLVDGFSVGPTTPTSLSVVVSPGLIYQQAPLESTAISALPVDTHVILKQGIALDPTPLTLTPPQTIGQAVNVLIQVQYQDADTDGAVLNYYNAADPTNPLRGPGNNGQQQSTNRRGIVAISPKYGVPNTAGSQTTPNPDAGWSGLSVVTLSYGQSQINPGNIVQYSGIPIIGAKLGQIPQAVQSNTWNFAYDSGTSGLNIQATLFPVPLSIGDGFRCSVKLARNLVPGANLSVNGTSGTIVRPGNINVGPNDFQAADILSVVRNGTNWIVDSAGNSLSIIDTAITRTVGGPNPDFADLPTAFSWLSRRRILPTGSVTLQLAAGVGASKFVQTTPVSFHHENGERVFIQGAPLSAPIPQPAILTSAGFSAPNRASDTAANLTALRAAYSTEIFFANGSSLSVIGNLGNLQDVLLTSDQTGVGVNILNLASGTQTLTRVSAVNAQNVGLIALSSSTNVYGTCHFLGAGLHGVVVSNNGTMILQGGAALSCQSNAFDGLSVTGGAVVTANDFSTNGPPVYARANGQYGVEGNAAIVVLAASGQSRNNALAGYFNSNPGVIRADGCISDGNPNGFQALYFAQISAVNTSGASSVYAYVANNSSQIIRIGGTATAPTVASPAVGATGNNNNNSTII